MKKLEMTPMLRVVLVMLAWLLTFTIVLQTGTLANGGVGLIGNLVLYVGLLYLTFGYFKDEKLMNTIKLSLIVVIFFAICYLAVSCYDDILEAFNVAEINKAGERSAAYKVYDVLFGIYSIGRNIIIIICLLVSVLNALHVGKNNLIEIDKKEETKEETKE